MLQINEETREIVAFNEQFNKFLLFRNAEHVVRHFKSALQLGHTDKNGRAPMYKAFLEKTRYNPSYFKRAFNANMLRLWWEPIPDWAREYCYLGPGKLSSSRIAKFWDAKAWAEQAHQDGLDHLIPFILQYQMDIPNIRNSMGKGTWRKVCQNTKSRNKLLSGVHPANMRFWVNVPSTLLHTRIIRGEATSTQLLEAFASMYPTLKQAAYEVENNHRLRFTIIDTIRMGQQLGKPVSTKWSEEKWRQKHNEFTRLTNERRYSTDSMVEPHEYELGSWRFVRCCSPMDIVMEGKAMHHCVASYTDDVRQGRYFVYSIYHDNKHIGTAGVKKRIRVPFIKGAVDEYTSLDQAYGPCNSELPKEFKKLNLTEFLESVK